MTYDITALFCCLDDFCKIYEDWEKHRLIETGRKRHRACRLALSEMLLIMIIFHFSPCKNFKYFYTQFLPYKHGQDFPKRLSYSRFVQLMPRLFLPLSLLLHTLTGQKTGIYIADSTSLPVCHSRRISRHRVFKTLAKRSKTTMGWFFGLKLHLVINDQGEIMAVRVTPGNVDDRQTIDEMTRLLKGWLFADKGYISKVLFLKLYRRGLKLMTGIRRNMKNYLMPLIEKLLLRKRFLIETVFDTLKTAMNLSHTRHRSIINFCVNLLSCLAAYQLKRIKPSMRISKLSLIQN